jgi:hypothetical protein
MTEEIHALLDRYVHGEITAEEWFARVEKWAKEEVRQGGGYRLTADEKDRALRRARALRERLTARLRRGRR